MFCRECNQFHSFDLHYVIKMDTSNNDINVNDSNLTKDEEPQPGTSNSSKKLKRMCKFRAEWLKTFP